MVPNKTTTKKWRLGGSLAHWQARHNISRWELKMSATTNFPPLFLNVCGEIDRLWQIAKFECYSKA
jgi:hypothetical protein